MSSDAAVCKPWAIPAIEGPIVSRQREWPADVDVGELEKAAWEASYARGHEAGVAAGRAELQARLAEAQARVARLDALLGLMAQPLQQLDEEIEQQLLALAVAIARQLVRRELRTDPAQVIAVIREAVARLPAAARDVRVHLHPEDAAVVRECLAAPAGERAWSIVEDPSLARGGCLVRTESSRIDARLETRLNALVAGLLGEERSAPRSGTAGSEAQ